MSDHLHTLATSYCGYTAHQSWADFYLWECFLNDHPELERIVEIGTGIGGFSLYLQHQAKERGIGFITYDIAAPQVSTLQFVRADVFSKEEKTYIRDILRRGPAVLHCDGGDKPREVKTFAKELLPGSYLIVHDYGREFTDDDIPPCLTIAHADLGGYLNSLSVILAKS